MISSMTVLVVDDFSTTRRIISRLLSQLGFTRIHQASNGIEALEHLAKNKVDLVVTDWHMPEMDGLELVVNMRTHPETARVPVLMVTAESKKEQMTKAAYAGVNGYLVKPFTAEALHGKIQRIVARLDEAQLQAAV
ncbi:response regulator [Marinobacterium stanieri]|uniref:Two-component system, chemotaxis family, response regulator CheY n=1 Tax=Marinobacterium stanieri TaxID=49186 RepID=A0A1N6QID6_9GAMM|nr:response regulator [Marinobacterium stanieri]SIQ16328.1 two-component system, chemotaxis family, response regulator CheY [Marinobacterium stanieri]